MTVTYGLTLTHPLGRATLEQTVRGTENQNKKKTNQTKPSNHFYIPPVPDFFFMFSHSLLCILWCSKLYVSVPRRPSILVHSYGYPVRTNLQPLNQPKEEEC